MSSRFPASLLLAAALTLGGCQREARPGQHDEMNERIQASAPDTIFPGSKPPAPSPRAAAFEGNAYDLAQGQWLFGTMNCAGCHGHGGGGMGPALIDGKWRYGGRIDQIAASIVEGRPNGMPSWRGKLTDQQVWQLAAYVRSLSGQVRKDSVAARADEVSNTPPQTQTKREPILPAESGQQ